MLFCITAQLTPQAVNALLDDPTADRAGAVSKLIEAGGGKMISMYNYISEGPSVMVIFDMPDPSAAPAVTAVAVAAGTIQNVQMKRLVTQEEVVKARQKASQLRSAYKGPGK